MITLRFEDNGIDSLPLEVLVLNLDGGKVIASISASQMRSRTAEVLESDTIADVIDEVEEEWEVRFCRATANGADVTQSIKTIIR